MDPNPGAISARDAHNMRLARVWQRFNANAYVRGAVDARRKYVSLNIPEWRAPLILMIPDFVECAKELDYQVRVFQNKHSKRITLRWK